MGKKNYLFFGHPEAGWRSTVIYSIIVSCRRRGIEPWQYLRDLMRRLPAATNHDNTQPRVRTLAALPLISARPSAIPPHGWFSPAK